MPIRLSPASRLLLLAALPLVGAAPAGPPPDPAAELSGTWAGTVTHDGEAQPVALGIEPAEGGRVTLTLSFPAVHFDRVPVARTPVRVRGDSVLLGPFQFAHDRDARTLSGVLPPSLVPVYEIPVRLHPVDRFEPPPRAPLAGRAVEPRWKFEVGSPLWAGARFADGVVYAGAEDGTIHALDAATGRPRWSQRAGGAIRARPTVTGGALYVQADDGFLYKLAAQNGALLWKVRVDSLPVTRLPLGDPASRFDRFASDVAVGDGRLYLGTHEGRLLALDAARGERIWEFTAGDAVTAAPAVADGRVLFGSFDHLVYALDAASGRLQWKRDTRGAVVSTPALSGERMVIGNRCYDLLGLDPRTGEVAWKRYIWMSWIESSAAVRDGVAYLGSSDAMAVFAFDARDGRRLWAADVYGWCWGQPAVTRSRVYACTSSLVGYPGDHRAGVLALDRATGAVVWRHAAAAPDSGAFGFPGSCSVGGGRVFATGLDGHVYAFDE